MPNLSSLPSLGAEVGSGREDRSAALRVIVVSEFGDDGTEGPVVGE